jgi:hypothetical protein
VTGDKQNSGNWRELVMGLIGALLALSGFFAKSALDDLRAAVASATQRTEAAASMINSHSTKIELLELRVTQHDQRIETLERKAAAK